MELYKSDKILVESFNEKEVFGIGGPWIGNLRINQTELDGYFLMEKPILSDKGNFLV